MKTCLVDTLGVPNCRAYPDEKGIETLGGFCGSSTLGIIAEPIPMKRELKQVVVLAAILLT